MGVGKSPVPPNSPLAAYHCIMRHWDNASADTALISGHMLRGWYHRAHLYSLAVAAEMSFLHTTSSLPQVKIIHMGQG